jgi:transcriptional regulator with XRE-family HTH domain
LNPLFIGDGWCTVEGMEVHGARLRHRRFELGLTLEQVAERAEIDFSNLSKMERGIWGARPSTVHKLARVLDLPVSEILAASVANEAA